jgi:hypothetical protein
MIETTYTNATNKIAFPISPILIAPIFGIIRMVAIKIKITAKIWTECTGTSPMLLITLFKENNSNFQKGIDTVIK